MVSDTNYEHVQGKSGERRMLEDRLREDPSMQVLFVGSMNCLRHKPYMGIGALMQERRAAVLTPTINDFASGRYLRNQ